MSQLSPFMRVAELVMLRKTLHHKPLSVTVTVHSLSPGPDNLSISGPLAEHLLNLDRLPPSGYDVFDVTAAITQPPRHSDILGFQLRFGDESGSLVLHEALTQSLYCLNGSSLSQPLLVVYRITLMEHQRGRQERVQSSRHRPSCMASLWIWQDREYSWGTGDCRCMQADRTSGQPTYEQAESMDPTAVQFQHKYL